MIPQKKNYMRFMAVIDLIIIGFACISIAAFTATQNNHKTKNDIQVQSEIDKSD